MRRALIVTLVSLLAWSAWNELRTFQHPWGDLSRGHHTDHFSHMNAARAFTRVGLDLWRRGAKDLFPAVEDLRALPADVGRGASYSGGVYAVPGWPAGKPWATSWSHNPRLYPPGDLLLVAPVALLYHTTSMSFERANRVLITLFLAFTHVGILFALWLALRDRALERPLVWASFLLVYFEALHWTLEGFYDFAAVAPLLLCAHYLRERRGLAAGVAYAVAAFVHFRALFFAPLAIYAAWLFFQNREWRRFGRRQYAAATVIVLLSFATLGVLAILWPVLSRLPVNNPANVMMRPLTATPILFFGAVLVVAAGVLTLARAWLDLAILAWLAVTIPFLREAYAWHVTILLAWLPMPVLHARPGGASWVHATRLGVLVFIGAILFRSRLWPAWLAHVIQ